MLESFTYHHTSHFCSVIYKHHEHTYQLQDPVGQQLSQCQWVSLCLYVCSDVSMSLCFGVCIIVSYMWSVSLCCYGGVKSALCWWVCFIAGRLDSFVYSKFKSVSEFVRVLLVADEKVVSIYLHGPCSRFPRRCYCSWNWKWFCNRITLVYIIQYIALIWNSGDIEACYDDVTTIE
jgi:hypothetical protein